MSVDQDKVRTIVVQESISFKDTESTRVKFSYYQTKGSFTPRVNAVTTLQ